jgi:hypothetical protein
VRGAYYPPESRLRDRATPGRFQKLFWGSNKYVASVRRISSGDLPGNGFTLGRLDDRHVSSYLRRHVIAATSTRDAAAVGRSSL